MPMKKISFLIIVFGILLNGFSAHAGDSFLQKKITGSLPVMTQQAPKAFLVQDICEVQTNGNRLCHGASVVGFDYTVPVTKVFFKMGNNKMTGYISFDHTPNSDAIVLLNMLSSAYAAKAKVDVIIERKDMDFTYGTADGELTGFIGHDTKTHFIDDESSYNQLLPIFINN